MKTESTKVNSLVGQVDLFICASGFEDRCLSLARAITPSNIKNAIIFNLSDNYNLSHENIEKIKLLIKDAKTIEHPKNNAIETFDIIYNTILSYGGEEKDQKLKLLVDVSTFTREVLLILIKVLSLKESQDQFTITLSYTPAESYPNEWLSKGIREIRSIFGYSGLNYPSKKLLLIILNGFETERTEEIINSFEPSRVAIGRPSVAASINQDLGKQSNEKFIYIKDKYDSIIDEVFEFSCTDITQTKEVLESIISRSSDDYNIVIAPLNNKISTLAVAMVALKNDSLQVCYASANQYNIHIYSKGADYFLIYDLNEILI